MLEINKPYQKKLHPKPSCTHLANYLASCPLMQALHHLCYVLVAHSHL